MDRQTGTMWEHIRHADLQPTPDLMNENLILQGPQHIQFEVYWNKIQTQAWNASICSMLGPHLNSLLS